jgi:hypothetical protein
MGVGKEQKASIQLGLGTLSFVVCFAAWGLISSFAPRFSETFHLTATQTAFLIAVPVILGALARLPMGMLTDLYSGCVVFTVFIGPRRFDGGCINFCSGDACSRPPLRSLCFRPDFLYFGSTGPDDLHCPLVWLFRRFVSRAFNSGRALWRRLRDVGAQTLQSFALDCFPLILFAISVTGLALTVSQFWLRGNLYSFLAILHAITVIAALLFLPHGKFFHSFQRSAQLGAKLYRTPMPLCRERCAADLSLPPQPVCIGLCTESTGSGSDWLHNLASVSLTLGTAPASTSRRRI